jgi:hypothetical protein
MSVSMLTSIARMSIRRPCSNNMTHRRRVKSTLHSYFQGGNKMMDIFVDNKAKKIEVKNMAFCINVIADDIAIIFPIEANALRNIAKNLAADNN